MWRRPRESGEEAARRAEARPSHEDGPIRGPWPEDGAAGDLGARLARAGALGASLRESSAGGMRPEEAVSLPAEEQDAGGLTAWPGTIAPSVWDAAPADAPQDEPTPVWTAPHDDTWDDRPPPSAWETAQQDAGPDGWGTTTSGWGADEPGDAEAGWGDPPEQEPAAEWDDPDLTAPPAEWTGAPTAAIIPTQGWDEPAGTAEIDTSWQWMASPEDIWPAPPRTVDDLGLSISFLHDLMVKIIHYAGPSTTEHIAARIGLPYELVEKLLDELKGEHLVEVAASRFDDLSFRFRLTAKGEARAGDALARSRYASVAPVSLEQYTEVVLKQSLKSTPPSPNTILKALGELVLGQETVDALARALHSGRTGLIFGSSGNGKTSILEQYARYSSSTIIIPHALYVHGQLIRIYDQAVHTAVEPEMEDQDELGLFKPRARIARFDQRWLLVKRPVVVVGGELTQESLELSFDPVAHFYQAPPHLKSQDGMFVIDDFGRQRVRPEELLNRWIVPMERGFDLLTLHTGETFTVPFEIALMFSTNLSPGDLVDEAFLRRIPYKVNIPCPDRKMFREISRRVFNAKRLAFTDDQMDYFVDRIFSAAREAKGAYPRDICQIITDSARFDGSVPELSQDLVDRAVRVYFIQ